jgi:O-antigen/teichoic acid export membrane protein
MSTPRFFQGDARTVLVKKNIIGSLGIKGWSALTQYLVVPLSLDCLTQYEYGLWLTINTFLIAIDAIDVGLGNGLRNKLAEALALGDKIQARKYVSTTFLMLICVMLPVMLLAAAGIQAVDCHRLMNVDAALVPNLKLILTAVIGFMGSTFIMKFIGNTYLGLQLPAINNLLVVLGQTLALAAIYLLSRMHVDSLLLVVIAYTASPLLVYLLAYPVTFCGRYKYLAPSLKHTDRHTFQQLLRLGLSFFFIQFTGIVLFTAASIIIQKQLSPESVTPYQLTNRYYTLLFMLFTIIVTPLWAATTDAYTKGDWAWIHKVMRRIRLWLLISIGLLVVMYLAAPLFFEFWVQGRVKVAPALSFAMAVYTWMQIASNSYSYILLGIGKIRLITIVTAVEAVVFIPLQILACKHFGTVGIAATLSAAILVSLIFNVIQFRKISTNTAHGIWNQ